EQIVPAYVTAFMEVKDDEKYDNDCAAHVGPLVAKYGGKPLVLTSEPDVRAGSWPEGRNILIEFPDRASAAAWYEDPGYAPLIKLRNELADGPLAILEGL
ncbi:MAG: DUF1330 domain-containing protein, partial [Gammaproteobacteria bacterium]